MTNKKTTNFEYQDLKNFMTLYFSKFGLPIDLPPEHHPLACVEALEKKSMTQARKGIEMAIRDIVEMLSAFPPDVLEKFASELKSEGGLSLAELQKEYSRAYKKVMKRGLIKSVDEYYLMKSIADERCSTANSLECTQLELLISSYEDSLIKGSAL